MREEYEDRSFAWVVSVCFLVCMYECLCRVLSFFVRVRGFLLAFAFIFVRVYEKKRINTNQGDS